MEPNVEAVQPQFRSGVSGPKPGGMGFVFDDIQGLISGPPETDGSSFTALLGLPPPQAVELLVKEDYPAKTTPPPPIFPSNVSLIDRASMFSVFAPADYQPESSNILPASSSMKIEAVKEEPLESEHRPNFSSPADSDQSLKSSKRKERETKVKESSKKSKKVGANESSDGSGEQLPYVHVRARRGQATDSHSLAERARREKINARMKLLQDLVPGCNKISGTAMVLDEIINHVQALQRQVEFLSMKLAAVNPRIDFNFDALLESDSIDNSFLNVLPPSIWPEGQQINSSRQQQQYPQPWLLDGLDDDQPSMDNRADDTSNFLNTDNPLLSYDSPANSVGSASLHSSQLKMEL